MKSPVAYRRDRKNQRNTRIDRDGDPVITEHPGETGVTVEEMKIRVAVTPLKSCSARNCFKPNTMNPNGRNWR